MPVAAPDISLRRIVHAIRVDASCRSLLIVNAIAIVCAVIEKWDLSTVMVIYWCQNIVIGLFNILRIMSVRLPDVPQVSFRAAAAGRGALALFFAFHYGLFQFGYFSFLKGAFMNLDKGFVIFTVLTFALNHAYSFFFNYSKDNSRMDIGRLMFLPYQRIIPMHLTIIFGGAALLLFRSSPAASLAVLVFFLFLKTYADIVMHIYEHG
jgi:hypothetical protein